MRECCQCGNMSAQKDVAQDKHYCTVCHEYVAVE